jgi:hypothetical protein
LLFIAGCCSSGFSQLRKLFRQPQRAKYSLPARQGAKNPQQTQAFAYKALHCEGPAETQNSLSPAVFL